MRYLVLVYIDKMYQCMLLSRYEYIYKSLHITCHVLLYIR